MYGLLAFSISTVAPIYYIKNSKDASQGGRVSLERVMSDIQFEESSISVDAKLIGKSLGVEVPLVQALIRERKITSICERGVNEDAGTYRLTFFRGSRRLRLIVDEAGNIIRHSTIDFGNHPIAASLRTFRRSS